MNARVNNSHLLEGPVAFISSFYCENEDYASYRDSPLWQLRQELAALNGDDAFKAHLERPPRLLTWVAEKAEPDLIKRDKLEIVDRLVEVVREAELYVCILGDQRQGDHAHGSPIDVHGAPTAVSYFEIELYAAAMYRKQPFLFVLEGFDPGPRLQALLKMLEWAIPDWRKPIPLKPRQVLMQVRQIIRDHVRGGRETTAKLRERLVHAFYRERSGWPSLTQREPSVLFLNGFFENRPPPPPERVEMLIGEYRKAQDFQKKLNRLWLAARELMPVSYRPVDVQQHAAFREFLPYWDCVLGDWAAAASWHGWHGHLYAGTVAPLNSQALVRSQSFPKHEEFQPEIILPPDGALASAYYSIARLLGHGLCHWNALWRAGQYVKRALDAQHTGPKDNLLAIRGCIRLRMGYWPGAVEDFKEMLRLREKAGASAQKQADALMHLGQAYAFCFKGRKLLREAVEILSKYPSDPNLARARRKLADAYKYSGHFKLAKETRIQAEADAAQLRAYDQIGR